MTPFWVCANHLLGDGGERGNHYFPLRRIIDYFPKPELLPTEHKTSWSLISKFVFIMKATIPVPIDIMIYIQGNHDKMNPIEHWCKRSRSLRSKLFNQGIGGRADLL